jgi:hypothetical protein
MKESLYTTKWEKFILWFLPSWTTLDVGDGYSVICKFKKWRGKTYLVEKIETIKLF